AKVFYPSRMNRIDKYELDIKTKPESKEPVQAFLMSKPIVSSAIEARKENEPSPFILANTSETTLHHLQNDCIIPVFSKDNEKTIAHQEFIEVVLSAVQKVFPHHSITEPEIRVSHQIKGRIPSAIHKPVKELLE